MQVIDAACDECPISSYSVTSNCRFCLGRPCKENCKFGALSEGEVRMRIEPKKENLQEFLKLAEHYVPLMKISTFYHHFQYFFA